MPLVVKDRVKETTTTAGTGTITLAGAVSGFQSFSVIGNGNTTYYAIVGGTQWEVGIGTYTASGTTLSRDTVLESSTGGTKVDFAAGTKDVFCTYPAERSVDIDTAQSLTNKSIDASTIGGSTPAAGTFTTLTGNSTSQFGRSSANYIQAIGAATTLSPEIAVLGSDTNIPISIESKGTGAINLSAGSRGINVLNGQTVTALSRTSGGSGYTTAPTVTISPPTTAGGVQATATCTITGGVVDSAFTITNAGSGYVEQPTVTFSGGGGSGAAAYATVGGATVIKSIGVTSSVSINFQTPSSITASLPAFRINDGPAEYDTFTAIQPASAYSVVHALGNANANLFLSANGSGSVRLMTSGTSLVEQMRVPHTASAVNYVQVTGAATGGRPTISAQGSDTNIDLNLTAKGTGTIRNNVGNSITWLMSSASTTVARFMAGGQSILEARFSVPSFMRFLTGSAADFSLEGAEQFRVANTASAVNYIQATGAATTAAPAISAQGSDTNIDLTLTPKGTGLVRFGTRTATSDVAITGYLEIKDSGGTIRKLAIID